MTQVTHQHQHIDPEAPPLDSRAQGTSHSNISQQRMDPEAPLDSHVRGRPAAMTQFSQQHMDPEAAPLDSHVQGSLQPNVLFGGQDIDDKKMEADNDFGDSANPLWSLYGKEAKRHDETAVQTIKDDMDGVLIFVRSIYPSLQRALLC